MYLICKFEIQLSALTSLYKVWRSRQTVYCTFVLLSALNCLASEASRWLASFLVFRWTRRRRNHKNRNHSNDLGRFAHVLYWKRAFEYRLFWIQTLLLLQFETSTEPRHNRIHVRCLPKIRDSIHKTNCALLATKPLNCLMFNHPVTRNNIVYRCVHVDHCLIDLTVNHVPFPFSTDIVQGGWFTIGVL